MRAVDSKPIVRVLTFEAWRGTSALLAFGVVTGTAACGAVLGVDDWRDVPCVGACVDAGADSATDARVDVRLRCGPGATCTPNVELCCIKQPTTECRQTGATLEAGGCQSSSFATCSSSAGCTSGEICCATLFESGGLWMAQCATLKTCASPQSRFLCDPADPAPCPPDAGTCRRADFLFVSDYFMCQ